MLVVPIQGGGIYCIDSVEVTNSAYNGFLQRKPHREPGRVVLVERGLDAHRRVALRSGDGAQRAGPLRELVPGRRLLQVQRTPPLRKDRRQRRPRPPGELQGLHQGSVVQRLHGERRQLQRGRLLSLRRLLQSDHLRRPLDSVDGGSPGPLPYTSLLNCQGGSVGLLEMSGNVAEWEDSCTASVGMSDLCAIRGGSYLSDQNALRCDSNQTSLPTTQTRGYAANDVGFRCCL